MPLVTAGLVALFWLSAAAVLYSYAGYPLLLALLARRRQPEPPADAPLPAVSAIVPVHNEAPNLPRKLENFAALAYPAPLELLFVSDGSTDDTAAIVRAAAEADPRIRLLELQGRGGKAAALNAGLAAATHDIVLFTDASIVLAPEALRAIVAPFADPRIGCISGEDRIEGTGGEGLYGRYELAIRRLESRVHSIVGASGSFYAQRKALTAPFTPGLAPDFLSVLRTVEAGFRAIAEPSAVGYMTALGNPRAEFERKVRTLLRGITTLSAYRHLLNPAVSGVFALELWSHKVSRWLVPVFLLTLALSSALLAPASWFFAAAFAAQAAFYVLAFAAHLGTPGIASSAPGRIALFFTNANLATLIAWVKYVAGVRQELWTPSRR